RIPDRPCSCFQCPVPASAVCAAFAAVMPPFEAAVHAMDAMGTAGEAAAARSRGTGSLAMSFIDELYLLP
ncbi:MAG: hydroxyethylthiazole kinase, partial [Bacteroidales bacterium]|nr:hydroxyethylthiazole kinase [Bacteroidales bacterium]